MKKSKIELLPHNQDLYNRIRKHIDEGKHSIFYSEATGLGKSFIFMKLVEDLFQGKKVLYIVPKDSIWYNINLYNEFEIIKDNITKTTFADFNNLKNNHYSYDVIFIDEAHHLLSDIQGSNLVELMTSYIKDNKYVFGFTATPEIGRKMISVGSIFEVEEYGYDLIEAIEKGLFPKIEYIISDFDTIVDETKYCKSFSINGNKTLLENAILERNDIKRWLVYFSDIKSLNRNKKQLEKYFPDFKLFIMHSKNNDNEQILKDFNSYQGKSMLITVSMVLEGVHPKDVTGIILFRNIRIWSTFLQILGRICKLNGTIKPLVIDITHSIYNITPATINKILDKPLGRSNKSLRSIIDVKSSSYKYIELIQTLHDMLQVKKYRGFVWRTDAELSRKLGRNKFYVYNQKSKNNKSYEEIIDEIIDPKYSYRGLQWNTQSELAKLLNVCQATIRRYYRQYKSYNKVVDYILDELNKGKETKEYRGIIWSSDTELSRNINKSSSYIISRINNGMSYEEIIDEVLDNLNNDENCYRGIYWSNMADLSEKIGKERAYVSKMIRKGYSYEQIIDRYYDNQKPLFFSYRGYTWINDADLTRQLRVNIHDYRFRRGYTNEEIIDKYINGEIKPIIDDINNISTKNQLSICFGMSYTLIHKFIDAGYSIEQIRDLRIKFGESLKSPDRIPNEYRGIVWTSYQSLDEALGKRLGYSYEMCHNGFTEIDIINFNIDGIDPDEYKKEYHEYQEYRGYKWITLSDLSIQLGFNSNYISGVMNRKNFTVQQAIDYALSRKNPKIFEYRGLYWTNIYNLELQLGLSNGTIRNALKKDGSKTIEDYIDLYLSKKEEDE